MKTIKAVLALFFVLLLTAGCSAIPTATEAAENTSVPAVTPTPEAPPEPTPTPEPEPEVLFFDDFEGTELNRDLWCLCPRELRQGNSYWLPDSISVDGEGHLVIHNEIMENGMVSCGGVRTKGKFKQAYGYFEASILFPRTAGIWGAFWLYNDCVTSVENRGRDGAEIDIIEFIGSISGTSNSAIHWDGYGEEHEGVMHTYQSGFQVGDLYDGEYHTYALEWLPEEYVFYIDGEEVWRTDAGDVCEVPLYMQLTTESSSSGTRPRESEFPMEMLVDYVLVTDRKP